MTTLQSVRIGQRFKTGSKTYTLLARMTGAAKVKEEPTARTFTPAEGEAVTFSSSRVCYIALGSEVDQLLD